MLDASWQERRTTAKKFKTMLLAVGLNQTTGARYLGMSVRTVRRMTAGTGKVPDAVMLLLHLMKKHDEEPDIPPKRKRRRR